MHSWKSWGDVNSINVIILSSPFEENSPLCIYPHFPSFSTSIHAIFQLLQHIYSTISIEETSNCLEVLPNSSYLLKYYIICNLLATVQFFCTVNAHTRQKGIIVLDKSQNVGCAHLFGLEKNTVRNTYNRTIVYLHQIFPQDADKTLGYHFGFFPPRTLS